MTKYNEVAANNVAKVDTTQKEPSAQSEGRTPKQPIVTDSMVVKRPFIHRVAAAMFGRDKMHNIGDYITHEVVVPTFKEMISTSLHTGIDMVLHRDGTRHRGAWNQPTYHRSGTTYYGGRNYTTYNQPTTYFQSPRTQATQQSTRYAQQHAPTDDLADIQDRVVNNREALVAILENLRDEIAIYKYVTLADYYDLAGLPSVFTDQQVGWRDLSGASIRPVRGGWILDLPPVIQL